MEIPTQVYWSAYHLLLRNLKGRKLFYKTSERQSKSPLQQAYSPTLCISDFTVLLQRPNGDVGKK